MTKNKKTEISRSYLIPFRYWFDFHFLYFSDALFVVQFNSVRPIGSSTERIG